MYLAPRARAPIGANPYVPPGQIERDMHDTAYRVRVVTRGKARKQVACADTTFVGQVRVILKVAAVAKRG